MSAFLASCQLVSQGGGRCMPWNNSGSILNWIFLLSDWARMIFGF